MRIAVHTSEEDANAQIATLTGQGLQPAIVQASTTSGVTLHNIIVGRYETRDAANAAAAQLQRRLGFMPVIVPAPPL
ncbi:MAG TPA: SPOR domain-containing protein [Thermoanaerobaculia bacterium]